MKENLTCYVFRLNNGKLLKGSLSLRRSECVDEAHNELVDRRDFGRSNSRSIYDVKGKKMGSVEECVLLRRHP